MNDEYYMRMALREASLAAEEGEVPIGAVIVAGLGEKEQRVVAKGHNMTERLSDPLPNVRRGSELGPGRTDRIWRSGPKKGLQPVLSPASAPEDRSQQRSA